MNQNSSQKHQSLGLVFNIQKFSLHDGTGIRTLVFMKGCPLSCRWCSNPEGQSALPELAYNPNKCIGLNQCNRCIQACSLAAIEKGSADKAQINRKLCTNCFDCVPACPSGALETFGRQMTIDDVLNVVEEDCGVYARSGGGLTLSGGEPLFQAKFVKELLKKAQARGIDTAIETTGYCSWTDLEDACEHTNQIFYDIKCMEDKKHKSAMGKGNKLILENFRKLSRLFPPARLTVRTPVITGFNDSERDIAEIFKFVRSSCKSCKYELLPYHGFGAAKHQHLGRHYELETMKPPPNEKMIKLREIINSDL
jgi:pyruvate formate lyase activating enzyme